MTQTNQGGGSFLYRLTVVVTGGTPGKSLEAFIFFRAPLVLRHQKVGDLTLDSHGNGTFTGTVILSGPTTNVDAETNTPGTTDIGPGGSHVGDHVYIARNFRPCTV